MSTGSIDRVQSDLNAMREVLGLGRIWSMADVRSGYALAGSCALFALFRWPGSPMAVAMPWAAIPVMFSLVGCVGYIAVKSRTLPQREASRRREYRLSVLLIACIVVAYIGYQYWARQIGLTSAQEGGVLLAFVGIASIITGIAQQPPRRYPRSYCFACGLPMVVFGLAMPLVPTQYCAAVIGLMGFTAVGAASLVMHRHVRAAAAEEHARVTD